MKEKGQMSIATVVSLGGSSRGALKIVMLRIDGSTVTVTTLASITKAGMKFIRTHGLNEMLKRSGLWETVAMMGNGNEQS